LIYLVRAAAHYFNLHTSSYFILRSVSRGVPAECRGEGSVMPKVTVSNQNRNLRINGRRKGSPDLRICLGDMLWTPKSEHRPLFTPRTSHFPPHTSHFTPPPSHFALLTSHFKHHTLGLWNLISSGSHLSAAILHYQTRSFQVTLITASSMPVSRILLSIHTWV